MIWYKYIIAIIAITVSLYFAVTNTSGILYGDALGYYSYLPASVIYHKLDRVDDLSDDPNIPTEIASGISRFKESYSTNEKGHPIIQYSYGLSAMLSPGFLSVYLWDRIQGRSSNGFEQRYQNAIVFLNVLYLLLGLFFCYRSLSVYYPKVSALGATLIGLLGTNLLWFGFIQHGMAHVPQFMLISAVFYLSTKLRLKWSDSTVLVIALLMGLITIIRPVDIIFGIIPITFILEGLNKGFDYRTQLLHRIVIKLPIAILLFILPIIPQLLYWKMMTGSYIYDSYSNYHFHWTEPHILDGLLGAKNGWFMYTPVMLIALVGLFCKSVPKRIKIIVLIILPIHIYVTYAWYNYNYINGFGSRPMIHVYPLMLFGIVSILSQHNTIVRWVNLSLILITSLISLNFTYKQLSGKLYSDESTWAFNKSTFYKNNISYHELFYLNSDWDQNALSKNTDCKNIEIIAADNISDTPIIFDSIKQMNYLSFDSKSKYPTGSIVHTLSQTEIEKYNVLKSSLLMRFPEHQFMSHHHHKLVIEVLRDGKQILWESISINDKIAKKDIETAEIEIRRTYIDTWDTVDYFLPLNNLESGDQVKVYLWNPAMMQADFSSMSISLCQ
jgi:hypothetical protein